MDLGAMQPGPAPKRVRRNSTGGISNTAIASASQAGAQQQRATSQSRVARKIRMGPSAHRSSSLFNRKATARDQSGLSHEDLKTGYMHDRAAMCLAITNVPFLNCEIEKCLARGAHGSASAINPYPEPGPGDFYKTELAQVRNRTDNFYVETISNNGKLGNLPGGGKTGAGAMAPTDCVFLAEQETWYSPVWLPNMSAIGEAPDDAITPIPTSAEALAGTDKHSSLLMLRIQNAAIRSQRRLYKRWRASLVTMKIRWENSEAPKGWYRVYEGVRDDTLYYKEVDDKENLAAAPNIQPWVRGVDLASEISFSQKKGMTPMRQLQHDYGMPLWNFSQTGNLRLDSWSKIPASCIRPGQFPPNIYGQQIFKDDGTGANTKLCAYRPGRNTFTKENFRKDKNWRRIPSGGIFELKIKLSTRYVDTSNTLNTGPPPLILFAYDGVDQWKESKMLTTGLTATMTDAPTISGAQALETVAVMATDVTDRVIGRMDVLYCVDFKDRGPSSTHMDGQSSTLPILPPGRPEDLSAEGFTKLNPIPVIPYSDRVPMTFTGATKQAHPTNTPRDVLVSTGGWTTYDEAFQFARENRARGEEYAFAVAIDLSVIHFYEEPDYDEEYHTADSNFNLYTVERERFPNTHL